MHEAVHSRASARAIIQTVATFHDMPIGELKSQQRRRDVAWPRQQACWALRQRTSLSLPAIGRMLGDRDHTTVLFGVTAVERRRESDPDYRALTDRLMAAIDTLLPPPDPTQGDACQDPADADPLTSVRRALVQCQARIAHVQNALEAMHATITIIQSEGDLK